MIKSKKKFSIIKFLTAVLMFMELQPYFVWNYIGVPFLLGVTVPLIMILLLHARDSKDVLTTVVFFMLALMATLTEGNNIFGSIFFVMVAVLFLCTTYLKDVYKYFRILYACLIGFSSVVWVLVLSGVSIPMNEIMPLNSLKDIMYLQYPGLVMLGYDPEESVFRFFRFCGYFDEPGVVGTNALLLLVADRYNLRKPTNIIIFISGLISMSLFFYVSTILYLLYYFTLTKGKLGLKIGAMALFSVLAIVSYNNEITHAAIWERMEYDESKGSFAGNNRAEEDLIKYVHKIRWTEDYWLGVHDKAIIGRYSGSASVQNAILKYGFVGVFLYALFFIFYAFRHIPNRKDALVCIAFLFITLWQRPGLYSIPYVFFYIMLILNYGEKTKVDREANEQDYSKAKGRLAEPNCAVC
jgi:hypothetical protein